VNRPLEGRRVLLTGATGAIGRVLAATFATQGAALVLVARDGAALREMASGLPGPAHEQLAMDVRDEASWTRHGPRIAPAGELHGVVVAAAQLAPIGRPGSWEVERFRATLDVNVTGALLAVLAGLDALVATRGSVVTFSGGGATAPLPGYDAYAASKAALVRLTENLATELADLGVRANAIAPGFIASRMHEETLAAGPAAVGPDYYERTARLVQGDGGDPPELAAELAAFLVSDASLGITGKLISARWDPWRERAFQERLRHQPHLATLRRIDDQFFTAMAHEEP